MKFLFTLAFSTLLFSGFAQDVLDTIPAADSVRVHSVRKAVIFSAVLPGAGQVYNHIAMPKGKKKAYWKVPLIYAGLGATTYFALKNNSEQRAIKAEYRFRETNFYTNNPTYSSYDDLGLITLYDQKVTRRDLFFIGLGFVYLLQLADAAVEAHFVNFDVSEDLSMSIRPAFLPSNHFGMTIALKFR